MASDLQLQVGEPKHLHNLKSRGPSSVQAKGFRATVITIHFVNKALHRVKKKK